MTDLLDALETRAKRGAPRGADDVFARARSVPERSPDRPKRVAAVLAVAVVVLLVAAAILAVRHDDPAEQGPVDVPPSTIALDPSDINVVVANGSGIGGAAIAISNTLAGLGYVRPFTADTLLDRAETPLDTVYFVEEPDTRVQAEQVANDLGLSESAVQPYPSQNPPADMGLAQVLVVLGSAPGMLATSVASTLTPSQITVLVANGSGVPDAAAAVTSTLTGLGYTPIPPTNTVVDTVDTPLDTVYFATNPNTRPQAERVAADLGLPEGFVQPYPGVDAAPANIGLAQVLVLLGSAPNQLATPGDPAAVTVLVANGSGVSDAAGSTTLALAQFGYTTLDPTNTTGEPIDTPLDTVYFVRPADRSAAQQVARDLGLPDNAVLRLPPSPGAPVSPGAAQVVVVLGSAPNQLATGD